MVLYIKICCFGRGGMVYNVRKTLLICAIAFATAVLTVSGTLYSLAYAPFDISVGDEQAVSFSGLQIETERISSLETMEGIEFKSAFVPDEDIPAEVMVNSLKAFPSLYESIQKAEYAAFMSIEVGMDNDDFVYYCQVWKEYASIPYGNETIGSYGCGPTNVTMVVSTLTNKNITPDEVASLAERWGLFVSGIGTSHGIFAKSAEHYGLKVEGFDATQSSIITRLKSGQLIICSMGSGYFSRSGHFITLRGITEDGKILIADSYSPANTQKEWDLSFLMSQLRYNQMWAFGE
ncbi:MAG: hypothetical protein EOM87_08650 [Clostridia bacterium]|nr:hypothetical protein [Clostridia bacterium]